MAREYLKENRNQIRWYTPVIPALGNQSIFRSNLLNFKMI
jgi:hypothetical protein